MGSLPSKSLHLDKYLLTVALQLFIFLLTSWRTKSLYKSYHTAESEQGTAYTLELGEI